MDLRVGQYYRVRSDIAKGYEEILGPFSFIVRVAMLYRTTETPKVEPNGDVTFTLVDFSPMNATIRRDPWLASHLLAAGSDLYWKIQMMIPTEATGKRNYSPNIVDGEGEWFVPDIFRWQNQFLHLVYGGVIQLLNNYTEPNYGVPL